MRLRTLFDKIKTVDRLLILLSILFLHNKNEYQKTHWVLCWNIYFLNNLSFEFWRRLFPKVMSKHFFFNNCPQNTFAGSNVLLSSAWIQVLKTVSAESLNFYDERIKFKIFDPWFSKIEWFAKFIYRIFLSSKTKSLF